MIKYITLGILSFILLLEPLYAQTPIAQGKTKFLGNVYSSNQINGFENYWNQVTPENAGKWGSVERTRDQYNWTELDAAYNFAKDNGFIFRYHVLIWGNQQPSWIEDLPEEEQLEEITEWMDLVAERYPDIDYLEVANEPLNDPPRGAGNGNYIEALGGFGNTGFDWLVTVFGMARERFPNAKLVINEYNVVNSNDRSGRYVSAVNTLKKDDLIDVIGVQAHAFSTTGSEDDIEDILDKLAATGLPIMVTEMDIDGPTDNQQLQDYKRLFPVFWEHPSVIGVTLWGWRTGLWRQEQKAYLLDTDGSERPALEWLRTYVETTDETPKPLQEATLQLQVYPNPISTSSLTVRSVSPIQSIDIMTVSGKLLDRRGGGLSNELSLDFSYQQGVYLIRVHTKEGAGDLMKIVKN